MTRRSRSPARSHPREPIPEQDAPGRCRVRGSCQRDTELRLGHELTRHRRAVGLVPVLRPDHASPRDVIWSRRKGQGGTSLSSRPSPPRRSPCGSTERSELSAAEECVSLSGGHRCLCELDKAILNAVLDDLGQKAPALFDRYRQTRYPGAPSCLIEGISLRTGYFFRPEHVRRAAPLGQRPGRAALICRFTGASESLPSEKDSKRMLSTVKSAQ